MRQVCLMEVLVVGVGRTGQWSLANTLSRDLQSTSHPVGSKRKINRSPEFIRDKLANDAGPIARSTWG
jgi:hypothetical protein